MLGRIFQNFSIKYNVSCRFFLDALARLRNLLFIPNWSKVFTGNDVETSFVKQWFYIHWDVYMGFPFSVLFKSTWFTCSLETLSRKQVWAMVRPPLLFPISQESLSFNAWCPVFWKPLIPNFICFLFSFVLWLF